MGEWAIWSEFIGVLPQLLMNGLIAGGIYALIAIGYTMVYGILRFINFAYGEIAMAGAYTAFIAIVWLKWPLWMAALLSLAVCALLGVLIDFVAYKPLRKASRLSSLITAIGVSILLQNLAALFFGTEIKTFRQGPIEQGLQVFGAYVTPTQITIIGTAFFLMFALHYFVTHTRLGKAIRATADNMELATVVGIDSEKVIRTTFAIGSGLAAAAGILIAVEQNIEPTMGVMPGVKAFTAAVVGGIGSIHGAMLGGMLIGFAENLGVWFLPSGYKDAIAFVVLIFFLLFKPKGLLGGRLEEDVRA